MHFLSENKFEKKIERKLMHTFIEATSNCNIATHELRQRDRRRTREIRNQYLLEIMKKITNNLYSY